MALQRDDEGVTRLHSEDVEVLDHVYLCDLLVFVCFVSCRHDVDRFRPDIDTETMMQCAEMLSHQCAFHLRVFFCFRCP